MADDATDAVPTKDEVVERIDRAWHELQATIGAATEDELTRPGPGPGLSDGGWSVKDHLAHLAAWERSLLALLTGQDRAAAVGADAGSYRTAGVDSLNEGIYRRTTGLPLAAVLSDLRLGHERLLAALDPLSAAELERPATDFEPSDPDAPADPVVGWVAGNTYEHYDEHLAAIRALLDPSPAR